MCKCYFLGLFTHKKIHHDTPNTLTKYTNTLHCLKCHRFSQILYITKDLYLTIFLIPILQLTKRKPVIGCHKCKREIKIHDYWECDMCGVWFSLNFYVCPLCGYSKLSI